MTAAVTGIAMLRNASNSSSMDSATTPAISSGMRAMLDVLSIAAAVAPPTCTWSAAPPVAAGITSARSARTRSSVAASCGPVAGITVSRAVSPAGFSCGGCAAATPAVLRSWPARRFTSPLPAPPARSVTTTSGPFAPAPKPPASMSYACRVDLPAGSLPASGVLDQHTCAEIAGILRRRGLANGEGRPFTPVMVQRVIRTYQLRSRRQRLTDTGLIPLDQMAGRLGVSTATVKDWYHAGIVGGQRYNDKGEVLYHPPGPNPPARHQGRRHDTQRPA